MAMPIATSPRNNPSHAMLHKSLHENVKAHGAVGDEVTNDRAAIQAAIDAASAAGGSGQVYFPAGDYLIGSKLTLEGKSVTLTGPGPRQIGALPNDHTGAKLRGDFSGPMIERVTSAAQQSIVIQDLAIWNTHATGQGISLAGMNPGSGIFRCDITAWKGIEYGTNVFSSFMQGVVCRRVAGALSGSRGIEVSGHQFLAAIETSSYEVGLNIANDASVIGVTAHSIRAENCVEGIHIGPLGGHGILLSGISMEACDTGIKIHGCNGATIAGASIMGSAASPAGGSIYGVDIGDAGTIVLTGVDERGTHTTGFVRIRGAAANLQYGLVFVGVESTTAWVIENTSPTYTMIGCKGIADVVRAPVIATASLPAAATKEDGRLVIEDNGAGDRNLVVYAGGQRFRIDGGAAI